VTALPQKLHQVLAGLTDGRLPSWYLFQEAVIWDELSVGPTRPGEQTKRRKALRGWLGALEHSGLSKEWRELSADCADARADAGALVLRSMLIALRPSGILNEAATKKSVRTIRAAAGKLKKALAIAQASGVTLWTLAPGRALVPLAEDAASMALGTVQGRNQTEVITKATWKLKRARTIAAQVSPQPVLLLAWLDELQKGCDVVLETRTPGRRGSGPARRARVLAVRLVDEFHHVSGKRKWTLAAALAGAASGCSVDAESLRIAESRN
jgi:hypothetical protein